MRKLLFIMAIALVSCEPIDISIEPQETDICRRMWWICPTTLVGSNDKDSTDLYWTLADMDMELLSIDSTQFFFQ